MEAAVRPLPAAVRSLLQSSCHINSLRRAVEELVYNSLDSKATSIAVRINYSDFSIQVVDNGSGISKPDMVVIGTKFMTSKCTDVQDMKAASSQYGIGGRSLASLIDISAYVGITSHHRNNDETLLKVFRNGKAEEVYETVRRPSKGTTVEIKGLLYNLKIQRKNLNAFKELQEIKKFLEHMAIFHIGVSFSLRDDVKNAVVIKLPKCKDLFEKIHLIYALSESEKWQELQIEKNSYKVKAYLGMQCRDNDNIQFIYVNGRHLFNSKLHSIVNLNLSNLFTSENINNSKHARVKEGDEIKRISNPFYIIFISCPCNDYDMTEINNKSLIEFHNWSAVIGLLKTLTNVFAESLQPKTAAVKANMQKPAVGTKANNIQEKVANIIEMALKSNPRKLHIQNGIKGKVAKRYNKRHNNKTYKAGTAFTSNKNHSKINKLTLESVKPVLKSASKDTVTYPQANIKEDITKKNKIIKQMKKADLILENNLDIKLENCKQNQKLPTKTNHVYLSKKTVNEVFQAVEGSVKERCRNISTHAVNLMRKYNKFKHSQKRHVTVRATTKTSNIYKAKAMESIQRRSGRIIIREFIPFPKNCNRKKVYQEYLRQQSLNNNEIKSRYDLVQTIIKTQKSESISRPSLRKTNRIIRKKNTEKNKRCDNIQPINDIAVLTYESHCYNQNVSSNHCQYLNKNNKKRIETSKQYVTSNSINTKFKLPESNDYFVPSIISTEKNLQKAGSIPHVKETTSKLVNCFKQPRVQEGKTCLLKSVAEKNKQLYNKKSASLTESRVKNPVYDFDEEVNKKIHLSLSQDTLQKYDQIKSFERVMLQATDDVDNTGEQSENKDLPKINSTYIVQQPFIQKTIDIYNSSNDLCTNNLIVTPNNIPHINYSNKWISKENGHTNDRQEFGNESVSKYLTEYINYYSNISNDIKKEIKIGHQRIEVTFESRSYPHVIINESRNSFNNTEMVDPLTLCQTIMESSDVFETKSLDFGSTCAHKNENQNALIASDSCNVLNEQQMVAILPNGQVRKQCHHQSFEGILNDPNRTGEENVNNSPDANGNNYSLNFLESPILCYKITDKTVGKNKISVDRNRHDEVSMISAIKKDLMAIVFEATNANGNNYYLDEKTGMTLRNEVLDKVDTGNFSVKRRPSFVPKGFSPIFANKVNINTMELLSQEYFTRSLYENFVKDVEKCSEVYEANVQNLAQPTDMDRAQSKFRKLTASIVFDGTAIASAKVLGQVDCKFIACLMQGRQGRYLVLVDQHAADERVHLETLLDEYKTDLTWKSALCEGFKLTITSEEFFYLENFENSFKKLGLKWTIDPLMEDEISVFAIPLAILGKNMRKREVIVRTTTAVIREHVKTLKFTNGARNVPQSLMDLVNMEACRSAVRFGAALSGASCERLVRALARCAAPFQCAHGRPTVTLLFAVTPQRRTYEVDMKKLRKWKKNEDQEYHKVKH